MMDRGYFIYNGTSSEDVGLRVERYPQRIIPARKTERVSVPGRNGDLLFAQDAYENYEQAYDVWIDPLRADYNSVSKSVAAWLMSAAGYARLEDVYDRDTFRQAAFVDSVEFDNRLLLTGKATIRFLCKPQRWLKSGEDAVEIATSGDIIHNPTAFDALPLITVTGSGAGELSIGQYTCTLLDIDERVVLDAELQNAYKDTLNKNNTVSIPEFPRLIPGDNAITWSGGVTAVEIIPRWWTL